MNKNLKRVISIMCVSVILMCSACSVKEKDVTMKNTNSIKDEQLIQNEDKSENMADKQSDNSQNQNNLTSLYDGVNLQGNVVEFSDNGFTLSPASVTKDKDGGEVMKQAAPGCEDESNLITISYSENTTFEKATLDPDSLTEVSSKTTKKQSVKKQSSVLIFGSCQDTYHWNAEKVIIIYWKK